MNSQPPRPISGIQLGVPPNRNGYAMKFNGSSDFAQATIQFFTGFACTISFWLNWTTFSNNDALAMELSANYNSNGGFLFDPNSSSPNAGKFDIGVNFSNTGSDSVVVGVTRQSAGTWHHVGMTAIAPQLQAGGPNVILASYIDGFPQVRTVNNVAGHTTSWGSKVVNVMCRNGASLFGTGAMADLAIWLVDLTAGEMNKLAGGFDPRNVRNGPAYYWTLGTLKPEQSLGNYPAIMTPSGGSLTVGPPQLQPAENLMAFAKAAAPTGAATRFRTLMGVGQ